MKIQMSRCLLWSPRVLGLLFAVFVSVFALDAFAAGQSIEQQLGAFLIHLIPTYLVLLAVVVGWRWQRIGGLIFVCLGGLYMAMVWPAPHWSWFALISGPLFVIGVLFLVDGLFGTRPGRV
jgi:hypothetical protein